MLEPDDKTRWEGVRCGVKRVEPQKYYGIGMVDTGRGGGYLQGERIRIVLRTGNRACNGHANAV